MQGRPHSTEYVTEFSVSYGYNGLDYADYKEPGGNVKVNNDEKGDVPHSASKMDEWITWREKKRNQSTIHTNMMCC